MLELSEVYLLTAVQSVLSSYMSYRKSAEKVANPAPKRIIFYRGMF
jgi:hypothetical protein